MKKLLLFLFYCFICLTAIAQRKTLTVKGTIIESATNTPLGFANVSILNPSTQQPVKGTLAKIDGTFEFDDLPVRTYKLSVGSIGYKTRLIDISGKNAV